MDKRYGITNLLVGNLDIVHQDMTYESTITKYVIERKPKFHFGKSKEMEYKYIEIFTGLEIGLEENTHKEGYTTETFELPYLTKEEGIFKYLTNEQIKTGYLTRYELVRLFAKINYELSKK